MRSTSSIATVFVLASAASSVLAVPNHVEERANPFAKIFSAGTGEFVKDIAKTGVLAGLIGGVTGGLFNGIKELASSDGKAARDFSQPSSFGPSHVPSGLEEALAKIKSALHLRELEMQTRRDFGEIQSFGPTTTSTPSPVEDIISEIKSVLHLRTLEADMAGKRSLTLDDDDLRLLAALSRRAIDNLD